MPAIGDVFRCALHYKVYQQLQVVTFYQRMKSGTSGSSAAIDLANAVRDTFAPAMRAVMGAEAATMSAYARLETALGTPAYPGYARSAPVAGLRGAGDCLPEMCNLRINLRADNAGDLATSSMNIGGQRKADTLGNSFVQALIDAANNPLVLQILLGLTAASAVYEPVVPARTYARTPKDSTLNVAAGTQSVLSMSPAFDWAAAGFSTPGKVSIRSQVKRYVGTYDIVSIAGNNLTIDYDLPNNAGIDAVVSQVVAKAWALVESASVNPTVQVLDKRRTEWSALGA